MEPSGELLEKLAYTNYLLNRLRGPLGVQMERYCKWSYGGAFNGAGFQCQRHYPTAAFYNPDRTLPEGGAEHLRWELENVVLDLACPPPLHPAAYSVLDVCPASYQKLRAQADRKMLEQVQRVQVWMIYDIAGRDDGRELQDSLTKQFGELFEVEPLESDPEPVSGAIGAEAQCDLELVLPAPAPHDAIVQRLRKIFPGLDGSLFGQGRMVINHQGGACLRPELKFAQLTARQF
jgi:hypothetical protein